MMRKFWILMFVQALVFCGLFLCDSQGSQRDLFSRDAKTYFTDYYVPRAWLDSENCFKDAENPCNYPPAGFAFLRPFPLSKEGAIAFMTVSSFLFLLCLTVFAKSAGLSWRSSVLTVSSLVPSWIFVRTIERGNTIFIAAALICIFLAFFDSRSRWKRVLAAISLGAAAAMKIAPTFIGCLYLVAPLENDGGRRRLDWLDMGICGLSAAVFFIVPFWVLGNGFSDVLNWLGNAGDSSVGFPSTWGLSGMYVYASGVLAKVFPTLTLSGCRTATWIIGLILFALFAVLCGLRKTMRRSDKIFFVVALMLILSPNSQFYMGIILFPSLILWLYEAELSANYRGLDWVQMFLWLAMLTLVQIPVGGKPITIFLTFASFYSLIAIKFCESSQRSNSAARDSQFQRARSAAI